MITVPMAVLIAAVMIVIKAISTPWPRQIRMREEDADRNANETQEALGVQGGGERAAVRVCSPCQSVNRFGNQPTETQLGH